MEGSRTISELKSAFVRNQVRILSANLAPQDGWRDYGRATEGDLSDKTVDEVVQKCVYNPVASSQSDNETSTCSRIWTVLIDLIYC